jgi:hypothetical protein
MDTAGGLPPELDVHDCQIVRLLSEISPGDRFEVKGEAYVLTGVDGATARVMRLVKHTVKVSQEETAEYEHGIERMEMPFDTEID